MYRRCGNCGSTDIGLFHVPSKYGNGNTYYCARCDSTRIEESARHLPEKIKKHMIDPKNDPDSFANNFMWRAKVSKYEVTAFVLLAGIVLIGMISGASNLISLFFIIPVFLIFLLCLGLLFSRGK
jgi:hypothetical protein